MTTKSKFLGYDIFWDEQEQAWRFCDTGELTEVGYLGRPCGECNLYPTKEGHDGCFHGSLPGVMAACCGHGDTDAYVMFLDHTRIGGEDALKIMDILKKYVQEDDNHE